MTSTNLALNTNTLTDYNFNVKELAFILAYVQCGNAAQSAKEAGYRCKSPKAFGQRGHELLSRPEIQREIRARIDAIEDEKIAKPAEILQFYSSVMRGEQLDQFGIEASLDTRIKAANELAKHQIEMPMKLEQKNITNNIGSISLNFIPRKDDIEVISDEIAQLPD